MPKRTRIHIHVAQGFFIKPTKEKLEINSERGQKNLLSDKQKMAKTTNGNCVCAAPRPPRSEWVRMCQDQKLSALFSDCP